MYFIFLVKHIESGVPGILEHLDYPFMPPSTVKKTDDGFDTSLEELNDLVCESRPGKKFLPRKRGKEVITWVQIQKETN